MSKSPTIAQVAALASVSPASVSMILNERSLSRFLPETVQTVREAAETLGYRPKRRSSLQKPVRLVCPSVMNPFYALMIQGMQQMAYTEGYDTTVHMTYWDLALEKRMITGFRPETSAGVIFAMVPQQPELAEILSRRLPVVAVGDRHSDLHVDTVDVNNRRAGALVGEHLLALGHRRAAYLSTTLDATHSARVLRLKGLQDAFAAEPTAEPVRVISTVVSSQRELGTTSIEHDVGFKLMQRCLREAPEVTAIVAINDMVAYGVLDALAQEGLRVPEDYSVCGFDNLYPSQLAGVGLTTVEHSIVERGQSAFHLLLEKLDGNSRKDAFTRIEYQSRMVARKTTAPPRRY